MNACIDCRQNAVGNIVPHFARPAFLPSKEGGLEGREFVE